MTENTVELYIYDLSRGQAKLMAPIVGLSIDGIWHTSIVVYGREYFFGSRGIETCNPGATALGDPLERVTLGKTEVPYTVFIDYISALGHSSYSPSSYSLWKHNCNNFSEDIAQFLCGTGIPKYILDLPNEVLNNFLGPAIELLVQQLEKSARPIDQEQSESFRLRTRHPSPGLEQLNLEVEEARYNSFLAEQRRKTLNEKLARKERKKEKKRKKLLREGRPIPPELEERSMADAETLNGSGNPAVEEAAMSLDEEERLEDEERKKARDPPIVFKEGIDVKNEFDGLATALDGKLSPEEQQSLHELHQYMIGDEGSWALGDGFLNFVARLLQDVSFPVEVRVRTLKIFAAAALKDDIILVLHQDRKDHVIMNYAFEIDRLPLEEQKVLALFVVNMFENLSSSEWLMYISEWTYKGQQASNIRVTTKVAVHALLSDNATLQDYGSAIVHNLACKEVKTVVFDDVAVELTMALLQYFSLKPPEEQLYRCMKALARFTQVSSQEVPQLVQMIGPDPKIFKGTSQRVDDLIAQISAKMR